MDYYDLQRHWTEKVEIHLADTELNEVLVREGGRVLRPGRYRKTNPPESAREEHLMPPRSRALRDQIQQILKEGEAKGESMKAMHKKMAAANSAAVAS